MKFAMDGLPAAVYLRLLKRWWWLPVLFGQLSAGFTYLATEALMKPVYGSSVTIQVISGNGSGQSYSANDASSDALLLTTRPVIEEASKHLSAPARRDPAALGSIACTADATNRFVTCTIQGSDDVADATALNDLIQTFITYNLKIQQAQYRPNLLDIIQQEQQLKGEISQYEKRLSGLTGTPNPGLGDQYQATLLQSQLTQDRTSLAQLTLQESSARQELAQAESAIRVVNPAVPDPHALSPHPLRNAWLGLILGLAVAAALIYLLEHLDDTFRSIGEVTAATGLSVLGVIRHFDGRPHDLPFVSWKRPRSAMAESYRVVRSNILFANLDRPIGVLLVTSAGSGDGKTTTAINLAITMAASGRRVLLVDADLYRATLTTTFGLPNDVGVGTVGLGPAPEIAVETEIPNLSIVPAGPMPAAPTELFSSDRVRSLIEGLAAGHDLIAIDAPPVLSVADTRTLAALADAVILVLNPSITTRGMARQAQQALEAVGARLLGVAVNNPTFATDSYSVHGYETPSPSDRQSRAQAGP